MSYAIQGITDEVDTCDCCGRKDLKRTVALLDGHGEAVYYGTECAAQALRSTAKEVRKEAKAAQAKADAVVRAERERKAAAELATWRRWLTEQTGKSEIAQAIQALGGFAAARASPCGRRT
jgi:hypothetical protein